MKIGSKEKRLKIGDKWIENMMQWLEKKAKEKAISKKEFLKRKFHKLNAEKKLMKELFRANEVTNLNLQQQQQILTSKQQIVLELGLNFAITPPKFPFLEYIAATEKLCQAVEEHGDDKSILKGQMIRNIALLTSRKEWE